MEGYGLGGLKGVDEAPLYTVTKSRKTEGC